MLFALSEITFTIDEALCVVTRFKIKRRLKSENPFKDALDQSENYAKLDLSKLCEFCIEI